MTAWRSWSIIEPRMDNAMYFRVIYSYTDIPQIRGFGDAGMVEYEWGSDAIDHAEMLANMGYRAVVQTICEGHIISAVEYHYHGEDVVFLAVA